MGAQDILHEIITPVNKLIDSTKDAIGRIFEPWHKVRMAKATAKEIKFIGEALRENADIPILYEKGNITADSTNFDEFVKRTQARMAYQELVKQENIESVFQKAYELLENEETCSEEPVDKDWINRFFNSVQDISDEDMQTLWAKILAGEVIQPKKYSLRTLETLKNLSNEEAKLFQKLSPYILNSSRDDFILSDSNIINIPYVDILKVIDCGLITSTSVSFSSSLNAGDTKYFFTKNYHISITAKRSVKFNWFVHLLTKAGKELLSIIDRQEIEDKVFTEYCYNLFKSYMQDIKIEVFRLKSITETNFSYESPAIMTFEE